MKNAALTVIALFAWNVAHACPDLSGAYLCTMNNETEELDVTQSVVDGVTQYHLVQNGRAWAPIITDGVERDFADVDQISNGKYIATCEAQEAMLINARGQLVADGQTFGHIALSIRATRDARGNVLQYINGSITGDFGEIQLDQQERVCLRR